MSVFTNPDQICLLRDLLSPKQNKSTSDSEDDDEAPKQQFTPADIGPSEIKKSKQIVDKDLDKPKLPKSLEEWEEMQRKEDAELLESRKTPEYKMSYRQAVGTEDVFLQMGLRTSSSASCEDLVVEILLPDETVPADKMNLSITENEIDLQSPVYRLKLPMVHPLNVDRCKAKYDTEIRKMILTLRLKRELDFVNF